MLIEPRKESDRGWWSPENIGVIYHSHLDGAVCTECALRIRPVDQESKIKEAQSWNYRRDRSKR